MYPIVQTYVAALLKELKELWWKLTLDHFMKNFTREVMMKRVKKHKEEGEADDEVLLTDHSTFLPCTTWRAEVE